jgi:hypothetical protein
LNNNNDDYEGSENIFLIDENQKLKNFENDDEQLFIALGNGFFFISILVLFLFYGLIDLKK